MNKKKLIIGAIVIGAVGLYLYRRNKAKSLTSLSASEIADVSTNRPASGDEVILNQTRASYVDCYTDSRGVRCCRDRRTGDIFCGSDLRR